MSLDVVGFGESSVDYVYVVPELPRAGAAKLRITSSFSSGGGQVATTIAACAALGLRAAYLGAIGDDEQLRRIRAELQRRGVDTTRIIVRRAATRYAVILVEERTGERVVLWERDPALDVPPALIDRSLVAGTRVVHVDATDIQAAIRLAELARQAGAVVTCDIDQVTPGTTDLLRLVTHPILAAGVPAALTGADDVEWGLRVLRKTHPGVLWVTLGDRGAAVLDGDQFFTAAAVPVQPVDTTSAGDVFRAGVIYGIVQGWPTARTLIFANTAAAVCCTRAGAMSSVPSLEEVLAQLDLSPPPL